ncbi:DUF6079 family protein [Alicyclobacillus tolerans]|uniref:DUF6079 family protein n=1 Tax=Alicyclobacillus tolerans TaxID=90970 RepID=UPI001F2346F7|nr:DUF6079 family protein [Alicyclobacillus tolerans]MCF8567890.1 DUF6079 family protein [Alicyclobacillus tolerans]
MATYGELFTLNPIETVIELNDADNKSKAKRLVSTFVVTPTLAEQIEEVAIPQLDVDDSTEGKGIFFVGNYGTGKSHVMSFLSLIAEDEAFLSCLNDQTYCELLKPISGKYKVKRLQLAGTLMSLYDIVADQLCELAVELGFNFEFKPATKVPNVKIEFMRYMQAFEEVYPNKGVLLVIDELLHYLESRNDHDLKVDLSTLQALGECSGESRFIFIAGLQQSLFNNPRFNHMASEVTRIRRRFNDFVIDNKGVEQLVEQYLFKKTEAQKAVIRELLRQNSEIFEVLASDLDRLVSLFPAHPRFLDEFQQVFVVERREILTVLSKEARKLLDQEISGDNLNLITSDKYWEHIERDQGLRSNRDVSRVIANVSTITSHIFSNMGSNEDKVAAVRLIRALGVNRLTTPSITDEIGLTPEELKNNLLWRTKIPLEDGHFLTLACKRLLERTREAVNGQFLALSPTSGQYYVDPTRDVDYEQQVMTRSKNLFSDVVQRYLNEIFTRALEINNSQPVIEGRLWQYRLLWADKNVERPGWLFFGFPNQRSTAQPPKDFYVFIIPSQRVTGFKEVWADNIDETYWYLEDFPLSNYEQGLEGQQETFLDVLRLYTAAREWESESRGDEKFVYQRIAKKYLDILVPTFVQNSGDWISIKFNGIKKRFGEWVSDKIPQLQTALFSTRFNALLQTLYSVHFEQKYPNYPSFETTIQEDTRAQNAQAALEIICGTGMLTKAGRSVLAGLQLFQDGSARYEESPWLQSIYSQLEGISAGQYLLNTDLFEKREDRGWMKGQSIEAEWLHVILAAGVEAGYLVIYGPNNTRYDATSLREMYTNIRSWDSIVRVGKPTVLPIDKWRKLFSILGVNQGLLANQETHTTGINQFQVRVSETTLSLVQLQEKLSGTLPFVSESSKAFLVQHIASLKEGQMILESVQPLNSKGRMANLRVESDEISVLEQSLANSRGIQALLNTLNSSVQQLATLERYETILISNGEFSNKLREFILYLNSLYIEAPRFAEPKDSQELIAHIGNLTEAATDIYRQLHRFHSLDRNADDRKKRLIQGTALRQLKKLSHIEVLNNAVLEDIQTKLGNLPLYHNCTTDELVRSQTSLCPITKFDPRKFEGMGRAIEVLDDCEIKVESLEHEWREQLLKELSDSAVAPSLNVLKPSEQRTIRDFLNKRAFPDEVDDPFIQAVNVALSGLKQKPIRATELASSMLGGGIPLRVEDIRERFEKWLSDTMGTDQPETVRFILEE